MTCCSPEERKGTDRSWLAKTECNELGKNGQLKKPSRVFKNKHVRFYCRKLEHLEDKHAKEREMVEISLSAKDKAINRGNHQRNISTIEAERGELLLSRIPQGEGPFLASKYKPCPSCFAWVYNLAKHRSHTNRWAGMDRKMSKREVLLKAIVHLVQLKGATRELQDEVISKLSDDNSSIVKKDILILELGNASMTKNDDIRWDELIMPEHFKMMVKAVSVVSRVEELVDITIRETYVCFAPSSKADYLNFRGRTQRYMNSRRMAINELVQRLCKDEEVRFVGHERRHAPQ